LGYLIVVDGVIVKDFRLNAFIGEIAVKVLPDRFSTPIWPKLGLGLAKF
jgi:hypothetical protein